MKTITVSKAIASIQTRITVACFVMIALWILTAFIVILYNANFFWILLGVFIALIFFALFLSHAVIKWKIWAYERVDDFDELIRRAGEVNIIWGSIYPGKWSVGSNSDKIKLTQIIDYRLQTIEIIHLIDDQTLGKTFKIRSSKKNDLVYVAICICFIYQPVERILKETPDTLQNDHWLVGILLLLALYFVARAINPVEKVRLTPEGIWTKKNNLQKWKVIDDIYLDNILQTNGGRTFQLVILYNDFSGLEKLQREQKFDLKYVDKSPDEIEYAVKIFKQRLEKSGSLTSTSILSRKPEKKPNPVIEKRTRFVFVLLPGIIAILAGVYIFAIRNADRATHHAVKGRITYLDDTFGPYKNRDAKFLQIDNHPVVFQIFVGKDSGDFSPKIDKIDDLKLNDQVLVYYSKGFSKTSKDIQLNKSVAYIEKDKMLYFYNGNKTVAYSLMVIGLLWFLFVAFLKYKK